MGGSANLVLRSQGTACCTQSSLDGLASSNGPFVIVCPAPPPGEIRSNMRDRRFSFEFFPPKTDAGRKRFPALIRELADLGPSFVSVTFGAGGSTREGSFETCADILRTTDVPVTPHLSCIGSTEEQLRSQLDMYQAI